MKGKSSTNCSIQLEMPSVQAHAPVMLLSQTITKPNRGNFLPVLLAVKLPWADPDQIWALSESAGLSIASVLRKVLPWSGWWPSQPTPPPLERSWWVSSTRLQPCERQPWSCHASCSRFIAQHNCGKRPEKCCYWDTWEQKLGKKITSPNSLWDDICSSCSSLEGTRVQGKGDALPLKSDQCKENPFCQHFLDRTYSPCLLHPLSPPLHFSHLCAWAQLLSAVLQRHGGDTHSQSVHHQHWLRGGFSIVTCLLAGTHMLGLLMQDMPLKQRSCDTGLNIGWIQNASSYLETENTSPAWKLCYS